MPSGAEHRSEPGESGPGPDAATLLWALHALALAAAARDDLETPLARFCQAAGFAAANALLAAAPGRLVSVAVSSGGHSKLREACARVELAPAQALVGRAREEKAAAWSADLRDDPRAAALAEAGVRSAVACPIFRGGRLAAALELFSTHAEHPDPLVLAAAEQAAELIAPALEHGQPPSSAMEAMAHAAEEALRQSEDRFRAIFEGAGVGLALGTSTGDIVRVNRAWAEFLGYDRQEIEGRNIRELLDAAFVSQTMSQLRELHAGQLERVDLERQYVRRDGARIWGRTTVTRLADSELLIAVVQNVDARKRAEDEVRKLSGRFLRLQDDERRRIARSLHESAAQTVAALSMNLQRMERMSLPRHAEETLADTLVLATEASREIRTLSHLLHPPLLEEAGLPSSLRWYAEGFARRSNVEVQLELADDLGRLPKELEITLFRIVQESLTNVHRHSGSARASVRLRRGGPEVVLEIEDQGIGIPSDMLERVQEQSSSAPGVGIAGMRERLAQLGGTLEIQPLSPGTLVRARIRSEP